MRTGQTEKACNRVAEHVWRRRQAAQMDKRRDSNDSDNAASQ